VVSEVVIKCYVHSVPQEFTNFKWKNNDIYMTPTRSNGINSSEDTLLLIHAISHSFKKHISIVFSSFSLRLMLSPTIEDIIGNSNSYSIRRITKLYFSYILNIISLLYTRVVDLTRLIMKILRIKNIAKI